MCVCVFFLVFVTLPKNLHLSYQDQKPLEAMYHLNEFQEAGFGSRVGRFFELFCGQRKHGSTCFLLTPWGSPLGGDGFWVTVQGGWLEHQGCAKKLCNIAFLAAPFRSLPKFLVFPVII